MIEAALDDYMRDLGSFDARIQMRASFPMQLTSLRSGLSGWQYYDVALELVDRLPEILPLSRLRSALRQDLGGKVGVRPEVFDDGDQPTVRVLGKPRKFRGDEQRRRDSQ